MLPLEGIRVLDLSRVLTGPFATMILSDFGAEVTKVEIPGQGDDTRAWGPPFLPGGESAYFVSVNRNKRSVTLNLKDTDGKALFARLVARSDVLVENFRPGTLAELGFPPETLERLNPRLIQASITAFGDKGPYRTAPGYDVIVQGLSGIQAVTGEEGGGPVRVGFSIGDLGAGMYAVIGILLALRLRERTGRGYRVDTTLLGTLLSWQTYHAQNYFATGQEPTRLGSRHASIVPYQALPTLDGWINVAVGNDAMWRRFCQAIEHPELADDPRFRTNADRVEHRILLVSILAGIFQERPSAEWLERLKAHEVAAGPILGVGEAWRHPSVQALELLTEVAHPTAGTLYQVRTPIRIHGTGENPCTPPPLLGQHTEAVLAELGLTKEEIHRLRALGVV